MLETLTRYWWAVLLRGVAALLFGLLTLLWPTISILVLTLLFGAYALVDGAFAITGAILNRTTSTGRRIWLAIEGIAGVIVGAVTFAWPGITTLALLWVISVWALFTGALEIIASIRLRREIKGEWLLALTGVLSVLFGVSLLVWPATGALALVILIGVYALMFGGALVAFGLRLRKLHQGAPTAKQGPATT